MNTNYSKYLVSTLAMIAASALGACTTTVRTQPVATSAYVEVGPPEVHVRAAPSVIYEGHPVYWYNSHWYYRNGGRWTYYEREPEFLRPHRYVVRY
jgi:hypothetical protein